MKAGFVAHRELTYHTRRVRQLAPELVLFLAKRDTEELVELLLSFLLPAHQVDKPPYVMLHVPLEGIGVVLRIIGTVHIAWIHAFNPVALRVLGPEKILIRAVEVAVEGCIAKE